jgi:hypothetical protein
MFLIDDRDFLELGFVVFYHHVRPYTLEKVSLSKKSRFQPDLKSIWEKEK